MNEKNYRGPNHHKIIAPAYYNNPKKTHKDMYVCHALTPRLLVSLNQHKAILVTTKENKHLKETVFLSNRIPRDLCCIRVNSDKRR